MPDTLNQAALSYGQTRWRQLQGYLPGVVLCATVAMAAQFVSEHYGGPVILMALLLGMALNPLAEESSLQQGVEFCARTLLRFGVALLGARISFEQLQLMGTAPYLLVLLCVPAVLGFSFLMGRLFHFSGLQSLIAGTAVAICGVAAVLAVLAVVPKARQDERHVLCVLVGVTGISTLCMLLYPVLASALGIEGDALGLFLGASIHDIAQVVGAGYLVSEQVGDAAIFTKMLRVSLLVVLVMLTALYFRREAKEGQNEGHTEARAASAMILPVPLFLIGFLLLMLLTNLTALPAAWVDGMGDVSRACLLLTIAALGIKTHLVAMLRSGWKTLLHLLLNTLFLALMALIFVEFI